MSSNIEEIAIKTYQDNVDFFKNHHRDLFEKLKAFEIKTQNKERYALEYKEDGGYFDVLELSSNQLLYNTSSSIYAQELAQSINYRKNSYVFEGVVDYHLTKEQLEEAKEEVGLKQYIVKDILPIMDYARKIMPKNSSLKKIDKFIFLGVALGTHITTIDDKIGSSEYLIIEDDMELFRLSLFVTPYYKIATHASLHFAIAQNHSEFNDTMKDFLGSSFFNNRYIKYMHIPTHQDTKLNLIQNAIASQNFIIFSYDMNLDKTIRPLKRLKDGYQFLNISKKFDSDIFSKKPLLVLAAGPSLSRNIEWLKKNHTRFIIVAVSATLKTLYKHSIKPDIITHIDGSTFKNNTCMVLFEGFNAKEFFKDSISIFGSYAPDELLEMVPKENLFFFEGNTRYKDDLGVLSTPCVGSVSILLSLILNAKDIYLLGVDLALDPKTGMSHATEHPQSYAPKAMANKISLTNSTSQVKGNFEKFVSTTPLFLSSIYALQTSIPLLKEVTQKIYNLNNGAFLDNTIPTKIEDVEVDKYESLDKDRLKSQIFDALKQKSESAMSQSEIDSLKKRAFYIQEIKKELKEYAQKPINNENQYLMDLLATASNMIKHSGREANNLTAILSDYIDYILPYIVDVLNTKELTQKIKHIKVLNDLFIEGGFNILNTYQKALDEFFIK